MMTSRNLPAGWRWASLGDVISEAVPGFACGARDPNGVIQLRMNNVDTRGNLVWADFIRVPADPETISRYQLRPGDVMFNNTNSTELVGKSALFLQRPEPVVYSNHFTRLRTDPDRLAPAYLASWLLMQWQARTFERLCNRWIGQSAVKNDKLLALEIPVPPLPEQKRIAAILTERMAAIDRARAAAQAQLEAAKSLPAAYLRVVFDGPAGRRWPLKRLGDILELRKEVVHPYDHPSGPAMFVGLEHIGSGTGVRTGSLAVEMAELTGRKPRFHAGDIVYGYLRPYLNKVWIAEFDGLCSVDQYVFSVDAKKADAVFVAWFMRSPIYLERAPISTTPGQLPRIRTEEVASVELGLPPLAEQRRIGAMLDRQMVSADRLRTALAQQIETIDKLPAALLRQAFNGGL